MDSTSFNPEKLTYSGLLRFAQAVDLVMTAEFIAAGERTMLISEFAYNYKSPGMLDALRDAIAACQNLGKES